MTFEEIKAEVLNITRRPDLGAQTESAIKAGILKAHQSDFFFRDLVETSIQFDEPRFVQNFNPKEVIPAYRQIKYIRGWNGEAGDYCEAGPMLEHIHIESAFDSYGTQRANVFYMAGTYLQTRTRIPLYRALVGAYVYPVLQPSAEISTWITEQYPFVVVYEAARSLFLTMGAQEQVNAMQNLAAEQYGLLAMGNVDTVPT